MNFEQTTKDYPQNIIKLQVLSHKHNENAATEMIKPINTIEHYRQGNYGRIK